MARPVTLVPQHAALWRGDAPAKVETPSVPTGFAALDALLPGGGWPMGALSELLLERAGIGELNLLLPALARLSEQDRYLVFVSPPHVPYAPALAAAGIELAKLVVVHTTTPKDSLWAIEQCLRSGACGAVLAWLDAMDDRWLRRLQLAAEAGRALALIYRHSRFARQPSPAALRLTLAPAQHGIAVHVFKRRGGGAAPLLHLNFGLAASIASQPIPVPRPQSPLATRSAFPKSSTQDACLSARIWGGFSWGGEDRRFQHKSL
jgi:hypothetical protein